MFGHFPQPNEEFPIASRTGNRVRVIGEVMMGRGLISDELINQIKDRVDIAEVIGQHVSLTRAGQNLKGLCPFHQEKTASFSVSPSRQIFHCFGCGAGGNVFTFLTKLTGDSFPDTVRQLGRKVGVEVPDASDNRPDRQQAQISRLEGVTQSAARWYQTNLSNAAIGRQARTYLQERGIRRETIERFGLGFAPHDGLVARLVQEGFTHEEMVSAGLVGLDESGSHKARTYERFRRRVMFPIVDLRRRILGFGGRALGSETPKYLNSPETLLFKKGQTLFALDQAREAAGQVKSLIVVEGYFDAVALHQAGIRNVVATLGTALTLDHVQIIRRFVSTVVLLFDPDAAGVRASLKSLDLFVNSGLSVKVISLPEGDDPDTYVRRHPPEAFNRLQEQAPSLLDFAVDHSLRAAQAGSLEERIRSVDEVLRIIHNSTHPLEREERLRRVADRLGLSLARVIDRFPSVTAQQKPKPERQLHSAVPKVKPHVEERELVYLLLHGQLAAHDIDRLSPELFVMPDCRRAIHIALAHRDGAGRLAVRAALDAMLLDADTAALATELSLLEQHCDDVPAHTRDCLEKLERKQREAELQRLIGELKAAEADRREDDVRRLNVRINEMRKQKAGLSPLSPATSKE